MFTIKKILVMILDLVIREAVLGCGTGGPAGFATILRENQSVFCSDKRTRTSMVYKRESELL